MSSKRTLKILIISLLTIVIVCAPWLLNVSGANYDIDSPFTNTPPNIDGVISDNEWDNAPSIELEHGFLMVQNDGSNLYILIDLTGDTVDDPLIPLIPDEPWGDFFDVSFDVNTNSEIDNRDIIYGIHPDTQELGLSKYQELGMYSGIQATSSLLARGFRASFNSITAHRIWELSIDLDEIDAVPDGLIRIGVRTHSLNPRFFDLLPENIDQDFTNLVEIKLAKRESNTPNSDDITTTIKPPSKDSTIIAVGGVWETYGSELFIDLGNHRSRGLIQFDLSSIPQGSKVSSATLRLYYEFMSDNPAGRTYIAYKVTQLWAEEGVTWEKYDGTNEWTESGAYPARVPSYQGTWITWDVTLIARDWIEEGQANYGLLIKDANEDIIIFPPYYKSYFHTRENSQTEFHPELIISYTPVLPTVKIYVKDTSGNPINRAIVTSITQPSGQTTLAGETNSEGYVTFEEVKSGSYTFLANSEQFESKSESVSASSGDITEKTILLEEKPQGIPGFPHETIILGLALGAFLLWSLRAQK